MPEFHLYGGPNSGETVFMRDAPPNLAMAHMEPSPYDIRADADDEFLYTPTYSNYIRITTLDNRGRMRYRYVHDAIYAAMRYGGLT
jgi:hypothetical protein